MIKAHSKVNGKEAPNPIVNMITHAYPAIPAMPVPLPQAVNAYVEVEMWLFVK